MQRESYWALVLSVDSHHQCLETGTLAQAWGNACATNMIQMPKDAGKRLKHILLPYHKGFGYQPHFEIKLARKRHEAGKSCNPLQGLRLSRGPIHARILRSHSVAWLLAMCGVGLSHSRAKASLHVRYSGAAWQAFMACPTWLQRFKPWRTCLAFRHHKHACLACTHNLSQLPLLLLQISFAWGQEKVPAEQHHVLRNIAL